MKWKLNCAKIFRLEISMAHPNAKNALQEWYQHQGLSLPIYTVDRLASPAHASRFHATVTLAGGQQYVGEGSSKKEATAQAAKNALRQMMVPLSEMKHVSEYEVIFPERVCLLIDLENRPNDWFEIRRRICFPNPETTFGYTSRGHPTEKKDYPELNIQVVDSTRPNAVDLLMVVEATRILESSEYHSVFLLTQDRFASTLPDVLEGAHHLVDVDHLVQLIKTFATSHVSTHSKNESESSDGSDQRKENYAYLVTNVTRNGQKVSMWPLLVAGTETTQEVLLHWQIRSTDTSPISGYPFRKGYANYSTPDGTTLLVLRIDNKE